MKEVGPSIFINNNRKKFEALITLLCEQYDYATLLATDVTGISCEKNSTEFLISDSRFSERGYVIRIYHKGAIAEYSSNIIPESGITGLLNLIKSNLVFTYPKDNTPQRELPREEEITESFVKTTDSGKKYSTKEIRQKLEQVYEQISSLDERIHHTRIMLEHSIINKLYLSPNKNLEQHYEWAVFTAIPFFKTLKGSSFLFESLTGHNPEEIVNTSFDTKTIKNKIEGMSRAKRIQPGEYDVILSPDVSGTIAHESFGHGVETDMFIKGRALAQDYLGKTVGSSLLTMKDGAASADNVASYFFDDEGNLAGDTTIIDKGIFLSGLTDLASAQSLGMKPTGNGRRESYKRKVYARMTNTYFTPGKDKKEEMIKSIKEGYLIENMLSGMEDPKNWGIQLVCQLGWAIKDGKLTGESFGPIYLTGFVPDVLNNITMVSDDYKLHGSGKCGKGYKEWIKVSDGGPYIKTKMRLG
ncbi:TldD/PmbA family protein [Spirochaeta cellobiosiphila]|uniref:TldD/PmbA family protein n=1 Tax=Spirochaeta cellobiosiphila TaxID=504483 RepID=UPI0003F52E68|nr:TldD/PmbA family protein [Spirochaeta cellobiosiphila]